MVSRAHGRVFFWLTEDQLQRLRDTRPNRNRSQDVVVIDSAKLLDTYAGQVELAQLNPGAVRAAANYPRGTRTFRPIANYR